MHGGIAHQLRRRVEAHRLRVQHRGAEHIRVMPLDPSRNVHELREARRVTHGEAVIGEAFDLVEAALGELAFVAAIHHAGDEFLAEFGNGAAALEGRHGAAELVGFRRGEARRHDG